MSLLPKAIALRPFGIGVQRETGGRTQIITDRTLAALNDRETQFNAIHLDLGILGLISLIGVYLSVVIQGARICRTLIDPHLRTFAVLMYVIALFYIFSSFGGPAIQTGYIFWTTCGIFVRFTTGCRERS